MQTITFNRIYDTHSIEFILIYFLSQNFKVSKIKKDILLYDTYRILIAN